MPVLKLTPQFILTSLLCPPGKTRGEFCDTDVPGLYIAVRAASPGEGVFYLRWKDGNNKTCHTKLGRTTDIDLSEARKAAKQLRAEIALGANPQAAARAQKEVMKYAEFMELHYLPHARKTKRSSADDFRMNRLRLTGEFGQKRLNQITRYEIIKFHGKLKDEGLAPATCDHYVKLLKHSLNLAIDWGLLNEKNPAARVPLFNESNVIQNIPNDEQVGRLVDILKSHPNRNLASIVMLLLATGARVSEALNAKFADIDWGNRQWHIPAAHSKSKRPRVIELNDAALDVINNLPTLGKHEFLFVNQRSGRPLTTITKSWMNLRKKAGLPKLRLHDCRHLFITWLLEGGASLYQAAQLAGHASPVTTQRYAHLSRGVLQGVSMNASTRLSGILNRSDNDESENMAAPASEVAGSKAA